MPSDKTPKLVVNPGAGRLPSGVVPAGALMFTPGNGPSTAVQMHLINPTDAHMSSAIGIPATNAGGYPLLWAAGGVIDGESVLDFIDQFKDLVPPYPNFIGYNLALGVNSGVPSWGTLNALGLGAGTAVTGGYAEVTDTIPTHFLVPNATASFDLDGVVFPADRGVVALYSNTDGDFFNTATTTLVGAISLSPAVLAPPGVPSAAFDETLRMGQQPDYVPTNVGTDIISLTWRLPYLKDYAPYAGSGYTNYGDNFYRFQLATYTSPNESIAGGGAQNWLVVHWKESYATTLASIQPLALKIGTLVAANCYSAVPAAGDFDDNTSASYTINRRHVFRDVSSAVAPTLDTFVTSTAVTPATNQLSGVTYYNDNTLEFAIQVSATDWVRTSFQTSTTASPPNVPAQFESAEDPLVLHFTDFGSTAPVIVPYYGLNKKGVGVPYSITNAPAIADVAEYVSLSLPIPAPALYYTPKSATGLSQMTADFYKTGTSLAGVPSPLGDLYNTVPAAGGVAGSSTSYFEDFVDELHRYVPSPALPLFLKPVIPAGLDVFDSTQSLVADTDSLQVIGNCLVYPQTDFSVCAPVGVSPDYAGITGTDLPDHKRRYLRVFDTRVTRSTGSLRIKFLPGCGSSTAFNANVAYDGTEETGHLLGGMILGLQVWGIGPTGWLDAGRAIGFPFVGVLDYYGCRTNITTVDAETYLVEYDTSTVTVDNGAGEFPIFVRVTFLNNAAGQALRLDSIEWLPV